VLCARIHYQTEQEEFLSTNPLNATSKTKKGRGGDGGNYRRNAARELERFAQWAAGDRGRSEWTGIVPDDIDRDPTFEDLDERVFRTYARYLGGDRALKQNTIHMYYHYISAWCGWCTNEGYLEGYYARRASAMAPLPEDDGRKPGDQQIWTSEQRHKLTRYVDNRVHDAIETYRALSTDVDSLDRQRARYRILKAARDRLSSLLSHTQLFELVKSFVTRTIHGGVVSSGERFH